MGISFSCPVDKLNSFLRFQSVQFFPELFQMFYSDFILVNDPQAYISSQDSTKAASFARSFSMFFVVAFFQTKVYLFA